MSAVFGRRGPRKVFALACVLFAALTIAGTPAAAADTIDVVVDQARIMKLPDRVATIVVGNPLIADVSLQNGGILVVTGKGYGATNLLALDRNGGVLLERAVNVHGPSEQVVIVYKGVDRESYSCIPECSPRITLGDSTPYFNAVLQQTGTRNGQAAATSR